MIALALGHLCGWSSNFWIRYAGDARAERSAVCQEYVYYAADGLAVFDRLQSDRDAIARLEVLPAPAEVGHVRRIARFGDPVDDVSFLIGHVEFEETVGIGPKPIRDGGLQSEPFAGVKARIAVMGQETGRDGQRSNSEEYCKDNELRFHACLRFAPGFHTSLGNGA